MNIPYPEQLLPRLNFKKITTDLSDYLICRKVFDKTHLENLSPIPAEELLGIEKASDCFDYSTNLPGIFELSHNKIELAGEKKGYFRSYWDEVVEVDTPVYQQDYIINENAGWFFLQIGKIDGLTIPFNRKPGNPNNEVAKAIVVHTPTNSNFWHLSVRWQDADGYISITNSKWKNNIIATVRAMLSELIIIGYNEQTIQESWYVRN